MRRSSRKRLFAALAAAAAVLIAVALAFSRSGRELRWWSSSVGGKGYRVIDGDTIRLADLGPVRYIGVDAPERGRPFYGEARRYNAELLSRGEPSLRFGRGRYDRYGRTLAYVYVRTDAGRTVFVNEELVRAGWAKALEVPPNTGFARTFRRAEEEARRGGRGMWAGGEAGGK
jgi:micrococcal nuclease